MSFYASHRNHPLRSRQSPDFGYSPASSPGSSSPATPPGDSPSPGSSAFLTSSVSSFWGGLMRRFSTEPSLSAPTTPGLPHARTFQPDGDKHDGIDGVYTPPHFHTHRTASPMMRPPPLEPLQLIGFSDDTPADARLLTAPIAEEIRIMVPARLSIVDEWRLVYSLDQDGASLATLYEKCAQYQGRRVGFVLCVKDCEGAIFGAYLSDYPRPAPKYYGTGECFLWRASVLASLPPPPSAIDDTANNVRTTTIAGAGAGGGGGGGEKPTLVPPSRTATPQSIRFKAFPYSGVNEYYMLCEAHFLSLGAGDGKFGLWLDDSLERGVSSTSQTFGNEPLSDEGEKFGVLGVEVWVIGG